jgi:hypothetical protein
VCDATPAMLPITSAHTERKRYALVTVTIVPNSWLLSSTIASRF